MPQVCPQISVRSFTFAVAVLAINFAVYRYVLRQHGRTHETPVLSVFPEFFVESFIPLFDERNLLNKAGGLSFVLESIFTIRRLPGTARS